MIPKTLSASSLIVAESCMARWQASNFVRAADLSNTAADTGTAVHGGLEYFVQATVLDENPKEPTLDLLRECYEISYMETFRSADFEADTFVDGWELCEKWFLRTDLSSRKVLSVESKETFDLKTSAGIIPVTYIIDRLDELEPPDESGEGGVYEVVDYKTIRFAPKNDELKKKIQARIYALAIQIKFPKARRIWVTFDCLRHDPIGSVMFTRDDNAKTYRALQKAAERIIAIPDNTPSVELERINGECRFCIRKLRCKAIQSNILAGGVNSVTTEEAVSMMANVTNQINALTQAQGQLNDIIVAFAKENDILSWDQPDGTVVKLAVKGTRNIDSQLALKVIGPDLAQRYGKLNISQVDALLKGNDLTSDQKGQLKLLIGKSYSEPSVKVVPPAPMD